MNSNFEVITADIESTYNNDAAPVAGDAVLFETIGEGSDGLRMVDRPSIEANLGTRKKIYAGRLGALQIDCEVKGSGTAGTAPEIGKLLRACGLAEDIVASTSVTYRPASQAHESVTMYYYKDGKLVKYTGVRGNVSFNFTAGDKIMASFNMIGHVGAETDTAMISPVYDTTDPEPFINASFVVDSYAGVINSLTLDVGWNFGRAPDPNAADGYGEVRLVKRDPNGSIDPEDVLIATKDFKTDFESGKVMSVTTGGIGATGGNIVTFTAPAISYRDMQNADREGIRVRTLPFGAASTASGDDDFSLAFT